MFKKTRPAKTPSEIVPEKTAPPIKYQRPKILLIDIGDETKSALEKEGYCVAAGTFGTPYRVPKDSSYRPVGVDASLPNYTEQEIIILDLAAQDPTDHPRAEKSTPMEELDWWAKCSTGVIDPRPRAMAMVRDQFDRIYQNGGSFIIFSDGRNAQKLVLARHHDYHGLSVQEEINFDNWSFLSTLWSLTVADDHGQEITTLKEDSPLARLLASHLDGASFSCAFEARILGDQWQVLATNKYGSAVAAYITPAPKTKCGWIFVLPKLRDKAAFLAGFLKNVLPEIAPSLFPHAEGQRWVHRPEYEVHSVLEKAREISVIQDAAAKKVYELEKAIDVDRKESKFLYDLLRETGTNLVVAVQRALTILGFASILWTLMPK